MTNSINTEFGIFTARFDTNVSTLQVTHRIHNSNMTHEYMTRLREMEKERPSMKFTLPLNTIVSIKKTQYNNVHIIVSMRSGLADIWVSGDKVEDSRYTPMTKHARDYITEKCTNAIQSFMEANAPRIKQEAINQFKRDNKLKLLEAINNLQQTVDYITAN